MARIRETSCENFPGHSSFSPKSFGRKTKSSFVPEGNRIKAVKPLLMERTKVPLSGDNEGMGKYAYLLCVRISSRALPSLLAELFYKLTIDSQHWEKNLPFSALALFISSSNYEQLNYAMHTLCIIDTLMHIR